MGDILTIGSKKYDPQDLKRAINGHPSKAKREPIIVAAIAKKGVKYERVGIITQPNGLEAFCRWQKRIPKPLHGWGEGVKVKELSSVRQITSKEIETIGKTETQLLRRKSRGLVRSL